MPAHGQPPTEGEITAADAADEHALEASTGLEPSPVPRADAEQVVDGSGADATTVVTPDGAESAPPVDDTTASEAKTRTTARRHPWLMKLGLVGVSTILTFVVLEIVFRLLGYQPIYSVYSKPEAFWRHDAQLGWSLEPGSSGKFVGPRPFPIEFKAVVRINKLGFRGPEVTPVPPGGLRVLVIGDSQAAGFEVDESQTYAALLQQKLTATMHRPVQVIDAAVRGYGTDQVLLQYEQRLRGLHPDLVVYHTTSNDPDDDVTLHRMRRVYSKPAFSLQPDGSLKLVNYPVREYPQCSEYRLDAEFHVHRIDSLRARVICRIQGSLADHSAFFSFVTSRIERNPHLVKLLYGLGAPGEGEYSPVPSPSSTVAANAPAPATTPSAPTTTAPLVTTRPTTVPAAPSPTAAPTAPARPLDYPHELTSILIGKLASDVEHDGAQFVVIGESPDLNALDLRSAAAVHGSVIDFSSVMGTNPNVVRFANDGHLNVAGHQRVANFLTPWIAGLLEQRR